VGLSWDQVKQDGANYLQNGLSPKQQEVGWICGLFGTAVWAQKRRIWRYE